MEFSSGYLLLKKSGHVLNPNNLEWKKEFGCGKEDFVFTLESIQKGLPKEQASRVDYAIPATFEEGRTIATGNQINFYDLINAIQAAADKADYKSRKLALRT